MTAPGWYNDELDPRLARWHDGTSWTDHTIVKAEWAGPGVPPPPQAEPTLWMPSTDADPVQTLPPPPPPPGKGGVVDRYKAWPTWARVAAPVGIVVVLLAAATSGSGDEGERASTTGASSTTTIDQPDLDDAILVAQRALSVPVDDDDLGRVITGLCEARVGATARDAAATTDDLEELAAVIEAAGDGAEVLCPDEAGNDPDLLNDVYAAALPLVLPATSAPTTTLAPAAVPTVTTKAPSPKPTSPPVTSPPATDPPASSCDPNYSGCLDPNSPDYDCAGGSGNGPDYTGPVQVLGNDHHDLDADNDGYGCESS